MRYDIIIIGGGFGGLVCGALLSQMGCSVLILEQGKTAGGCLQCYNRQGVIHDTGFHYVGGLDPEGILYRVFKPLGLMELPWKQLDRSGFDRVTLANHTFSLPNGFREFAEALSSDFPEDREGLRSYIRLLKITDEHQLDFLNPKTQGGACSMRTVQVSAYDYLHETFRNPLLISLLSAESTRLELKRDTLPLFTFLHVMSSYVRSSWRLKGGGQQIAQTLCNRIISNGGAVMTSKRVVALHITGNQVTEVECADGSHYNGKLFISDLHPHLTLSLVRQDLQNKIYGRRINRLTNTYGMFTVSLTLKPNCLRYANRNHYVYTGHDVWDFADSEETHGIMMSMAIPSEGQYAEAVDLMTPVNWETVRKWGETKIGNKGPEYNQWKADKASQCLELAERVLPGLREMSKLIDVSTPLTWKSYTLTPEGTAFGTRKDWHQPLLTLLSPRTPIPNLLLTGQSLKVHGIQGVAVTALETCAEIVGKEAIWNWLNN